MPLELQTLSDSRSFGQRFLRTVVRTGVFSEVLSRKAYVKLLHMHGMANIWEKAAAAWPLQIGKMLQDVGQYRMRTCKACDLEEYIIVQEIQSL